MEVFVLCFINEVKLSVCIAVLWSKSHCVGEILLKRSLFILTHDTVIVAWWCQPLIYVILFITKDFSFITLVLSLAQLDHPYVLDHAVPLTPFPNLSCLLVKVLF